MSTTIDVGKIVDAALKVEIEKVREEIIQRHLKAANAEFDREIRPRVAIAAMEVSRIYELHTLTDRVVITVRQVER